MRSSLSPLSALALLPLLGCPATDDDGGEPVDGASTVTEDCAPDDGPAWSFDIGVEDDTCTAAHAQPFLRVTVWEHTSTMAGQTWSLSPDMGQGQVLYFADPSLGLFGFDLATSRPFAVGHNPERLVVGGVEAMYWYDGCLVIVQPQMVPARVMRLKLAKDGRSIDAAMPLDVAQPAFASLGAGVVVGQDLYFIANSEKALYDSYGVLRDEKLLEPVRVFKSNLRYAWDQPGIGTALNAVPAAQPQGATAGDGAKK